VIAVTLAFSASIAWGCGDFLGGLRAQRVRLLFVVTLTLVGGTVTAAVVAALAAPFPGVAPLWPVLISGTASVVAFATLFKSLAIGPMSIVAPIAATYPLVPVVAGIVEGERPSTAQVVGMVVAVAGVLLAASGGDRASSRRISALGLGLAIVAAVASGVALTGLDAASDADPYWALLGMRVVALALIGVVLLALRPRGRPGPADALAICGIGVLDTVATGLFAVATTFGYLSVVAVIASLFPVMTVVLARLVLGERIARHQEVGVATALVGVAIIASG
jgi:drug/metabolite transporter (DMT)-like permease